VEIRCKNYDDDSRIMPEFKSLQRVKTKSQTKLPRLITAFDFRVAWSGDRLASTIVLAYPAAMDVARRTRRKRTPRERPLVPYTEDPEARFVAFYGQLDLRSNVILMRLATRWRTSKIGVFSRLLVEEQDRFEVHQRQRLY
jgi:hypothetical protein